MTDKPTIDTARLEASEKFMELQRASHIKALPTAFIVEATERTKQIAIMNASPRAKLGKLYTLVDEYAAMRQPYVACKEGCDSCCHMKVELTNVEAERIAKATGIAAQPLGFSTNNSDEKFAGLACPFLKDHKCSIYDDRPLTCRGHASFDSDSYWCATERMLAVKLPMVSVGEALAVNRLIAQTTDHPVIADIREFFPSRQ